MKLETREMDGIPIVDIEGNLDTNTAPDAEKHLNGLIEQGSKNIVVNFEKLGFISSAGLRVMLSTAKVLRAAQGDIRICNLNETVQEIFDISGFSTILSVFNAESDALEGFGG